MEHRVAILGGSGFIGRYVVKRLAERGDVVAVGARNAAAARFLKLKGDVGQVGLINIYLRSDSTDRLRDNKGKTVTGRAGGAVVMLSDFDEPTMGLVLCEGVETGIALFQREVRPVWACGAAGTLQKFPLLGGIKSLTIAADADAAGQRAADELARRWREAGREVRIVPPVAGDWADGL